MNFKQGIRDGIPIGLGYVAVSFAFGILAVDKDLSVAQSVLISAANVTSAGQFAGLTIMASTGSLIEMALSQFIINLRYMLMSISLSQKVDEDFKGIWRWILGFAVTDEIFAVAIQSPGKVKRNYFAGLIILPILGWVTGTLGGALLGNVLPAALSSALGVALYGMFIAVVIPKAREDGHVFIAVLIAIAISVALKYIPFFSGLSDGFAIIICTLAASVMAAILFPVEVEEDEF
ncbi:MAG: AzlC family ABC transporter permease [Lachnospiraceae bacterium]|nr:AzlC family ABC transporter permease [Lachnospiraceae bacterium]MDY5497312.1 AzlC family ABC transporter permease [Anaerobutyricum sp.]